MDFYCAIFVSVLDVAIDSGEQACPAFALCCEYGDICQINGRGCYFHQWETGFPTWCPLDEIK